MLMKHIMSLGNVSVFECEGVIIRLHHQIAGIKKTAGEDGEGALDMLGINYQYCPIPLGPNSLLLPKIQIKVLQTGSHITHFTWNMHWCDITRILHYPAKQVIQLRCALPGRY